VTTIHDTSFRGFASDNYAGIHPEVLAAITAANGGHQIAYGEDDYTARLGEVIRAEFGEQAEVFPVFNGTGANVVSLTALLPRWGSVVATTTAHIHTDEGGAPEKVAGLKLFVVPTPDGKLTPELLATEAWGMDDEHRAEPAAVSITQTTELGTLYTPAEVRAIADAAHAHGLAVHMDGARIWNAAVASGRSPAEIAAPVDSASVCFSKGLGAPVGSAVVGSAEFVAVARRNRKLFGGGMRQAGIIAAGALHALRNHVERLADDHRNARRLAEGLRSTRLLCFDPEAVETNIVIAKTTGSAAAPEIVEKLAETGVLCAALDDRTVRFVTHLDVDSEAVDAAISAADPVLS